MNSMNSVNYEREFLNALVDKFERSKSYAGKNRNCQSFRIKVSDLFPEYEDHSKYEVFEQINLAVRRLAEMGFVELGTGVSCTLRLCTEMLLGIYEYLGRVPKRETDDRLRKILTEYGDAGDLLRSFCTEQLERLDDGRPVQFYSGDLDEFASILAAVKALTGIESEMFIREFSIRVFKDSKAFEKIQGKVENLLYEYGDFPQREDVLGHFNLVRTPSYVGFKGAGRIVISGERIDFGRLHGDIAVSSGILQDISSIEVTGGKVITIENLTSFHNFKEPGALVVYLGGFHNRVRSDFIGRVYAQNPRAEYFHFGDIDAGGFFILEHLRNDTGIDFQPLMMDRKTLIRYADYTVPLTDNDRIRLEKLLAVRDGMYSDTIRYMLEKDCKLEQEAVFTREQ